MWINEVRSNKPIQFNSDIQRTHVNSILLLGRKSDLSLYDVDKRGKIDLAVFFQASRVRFKMF